ncbi:hypothetical protein UPYG_G00339970 [Umbra pygmaea]|uniref:Uncharacterized protein n=1 Tax=Umbra pygmaea TaxID=75934 RepID=A0ABD0W121_UMBPY
MLIEPGQSAVSWGDMSNAGAPLSLSLDTSGLWQQRTIHRNRYLVPNYLVSSSGPQINGIRIRDAVQLPCLSTVKAQRRQTTMASLSISESSLLTLGEQDVYKGFSCNRRPHRQKRPLPQYTSCDTTVVKSQSSSKPVYSHFSYPIRPNPKVVKPRSQSLNVEQNEPRPLVTQYRQTSHREALTVRGKPCLSLRSKPTPSIAPMPARTQLHIYLPTGVGEGREGDSESVDEGFMEEQDIKITGLKLQQEKDKIHTHPD